MSDELIDVLNNDLSFNKTVLKSIAHKEGLLHASVHIWLYTTSKELLIQKRSSNKIAFPNLWDVSVAGHITSGENNITSAIREIEEEIGLTYTENDLTYTGNYTEKHIHNNQFIDYEIHHIYIGVLLNAISDLVIQEEELSEVRLIEIDKFKNDIQDSVRRKNYVPHKNDYYSIVFNEINKHI